MKIAFGQTYCETMLRFSMLVNNDLYCDMLIEHLSFYLSIP